MPADPPPPAPAAPRRRWLRRGLKAVGVVVLGVAVFHRPLGHWAIRHFGGGALEKAGLTGSWKTSGSLLGGLMVDEVKLAGNATSQVRSVTMAHAEVDYDLMALGGGGVGKVLKSLVVKDLTVELDLTIPPPPRRGPAKSSGPRPVPTLPSVAVPSVRIENLNLHLRLPGDQLILRRFSLVLDPAKPGLIQAEELDIPGTPLLRNVQGITHVTATTLTLEQTRLWPDTVLERLVLDVGNLAAVEAGISLAARQGETRVALQGKSGGWFTDVTADMDLTIQKISQETLAFWGVPSGNAAWRAEQAGLKVKGPVLHPDRLDLDLLVEGGSLTLPTLQLSPVRLSGSARVGTFKLNQLTAAAGTNQASASGQAALPDLWEKIADVPGRVDLVFEAPMLAELLPPDAGVVAAVSGKGGVAFAGRALTEAAADIKASALNVRGIPVESAAGRARLAGGVVKLEEAQVRLNNQNTLGATGQLALGGAQDFSVEWQADARDLATIPAEVQGGLPWPTAGKVFSGGSAQGSLTQLQEQQWASLNGSAVVDAQGLRLKDAALDSLHLQAEATAGEIRIGDGSVRLDAANRLNLAGSLNLTDPALPLSAQARVELPEIAKLSAWSTQFSGPALRSGAASLEWQGSGSLKPLRVEGGGSVLVKNLKVDRVPEVLGLTAEVTQSGSEINVEELKASAGPWRVEGAAQFDGWHLTIPGLQAFVKNERLVDLSARIPWHSGTVPPDSPVSLRFKVEQLDAAKLAAALGRPFPVHGLLNAKGNFAGTMNTLEGSLTAEAVQVKPVNNSAPKLEPATVKLTAIAERGRLSLDGAATQRPLQPLTIAAELPLDLPALMADPGRAGALPLSAQVKLPASSLAFLPSYVPALRSVQGTAAVDFKVSGTVGKPVWQGTASVAVPEAAFNSPSLPTVKDVRINLRVDEKRLRVDEASVLLAGGRLRLSGGAGMENTSDPALDFKLSADEVLVVRDDNLSLRANAGITCQGKLSQANVRGQVDLVRGRVFKEIEFLPLSLPDDLPPPPPATTLGRQGAPALPAPFDRWNFDIAIKTRDPIRLMGNVAKGNAVADLRFSGPGAKPDLTGNVKLEEMWLKLPFSRLTITEGAITFNKEQPFDPQIDVTGESINGSRIVQVFVQGRALDPKVRLTSSPPLPEGEIAALLATGVTTSDLTSSGDEAAGRAAFVLLKQTYRKLFRKAAVAGDDDEPPRLSFDFSVFGSDPSRRGISAIYELNPKWRVIGKVGETGTFRGLLYYLIRFR